MASYPPPSFQSTIFDSNAFTHTLSNGGLTQAEADLLYYKYPLGQAYETLQQTDHTGLATFQAGIDLNAGSLQFPDNTTQTTAFTGSSNLLSSNNVWSGTNEFQLGTTFDSALIISNGGQNTYLGNGFNPIASGVGNQNVGVGVGVYNITATGLDNNTAVGYFCGSAITAGANNNSMFGHRAGGAITNGVGNTLIGAGTGGLVRTGDLNICIGFYAGSKGSSGFDYNNCIVIGNNPTQTTFYPTADNMIMIGDGTQTSMDLKCSNNPTMSGYTQPASSDSTQKIATTAWVQGCILNQYGLGTNILYQPNTSFTPSSNVLITLGSQSIGAGTWSISYSIGYNIDNSAVGQYTTIGLSNTTSLQFAGKYGNATQTIWANNTNSDGILAFANGSTTLILTATTTIYFLGKVVYLGGVANLGALLLNNASFTRIG